MPRMPLPESKARWSGAICALAAVIFILFAGSHSRATGIAAASLPPLPSTWPSSLQLGMADSPGGAAALKATAPFGFRYQYLAGGDNTGNGWATWNTDGAFVTYYLQDSLGSSITPVFTYYMLLQSSPGASSGEADADYNNLQNTATMTAYFNDLKLFFQRAKGPNPVVLHVEPDLWGYLEQRTPTDDATKVPAQVASTGLTELSGLPNNVSGFAQAVVRLRDLYAPNVIVAYHLSIWGTGTDIVYADPPDAQVDALATKAANFYKSLGANFDIVFAEFSDRDAGFKQYVYGDGGASWWDAGDFSRNIRFLTDFVSLAQKRIVMWQIPFGNEKMLAENNTWDHYQDNKVEWLLDNPGRGNLSSYIQAGVVAFLFGRGADGATCACDSNNDGITNPPAINGNTLQSFTADDDGGFFRQKAAAYYAQGAMSLNGGSDPPATATVPATVTPVSTSTPIATTTATRTATPTPIASATRTRTPTVTATRTATRTPTRTSVPPTATATQVASQWTTGAVAQPSTIKKGKTEQLKVTVRSSLRTSALVDIEVYGPDGTRVYQTYTDNVSFSANTARSFQANWIVPSSSAIGTFSVKVGIFSPGWGTMYSWNNQAASFVVTN